MAAHSSRSAVLVQASPLPLLALLCLLLSGCGGNTPALASTPGSAVADPGVAFPAFSDWRMVYITEDNTLRVVTLDGKKSRTRTTGAQRTIATLAANDLAYPHFSLSPDGSALLLMNHLGQGISTNYTPVEELISTRDDDAACH